MDREKIVAYGMTTFFTVFLLFLFIGCMLSVNVGTEASAYYAKELKSQDAIIKSPAIIIVYKEYSAFKALEGPVFYYDGSFYRIPDSYKGYKWTPFINVILGENGWTWELWNP